MKETVSESLERASPPKLSILLVNKQRIIILPGLSSMKTKQCNPVGLMDLWWVRDCSPHVSPRNADDWFVASLTCVSIYLFHLNFCRFLICPDGIEKQKRGNQMVLSEMQKWNGWRTDINLGKLITKLSSKMSSRIESHISQGLC